MTECSPTVGYLVSVFTEFHILDEGGGLRMLVLNPKLIHLKKEALYYDTDTVRVNDTHFHPYSGITGVIFFFPTENTANGFLSTGIKVFSSLQSWTSCSC